MIRLSPQTAIFCAILFPQFLFAATVTPTFDAEQHKIAATARAEFITQLARLGEKFPELSGLSDPDSIKKSTDGFHYRWKGKNGRTFEIALEQYPSGGKSPSMPLELGGLSGGGRYGISQNLATSKLGDASDPLRKAIFGAFDAVTEGVLLHLTVDYELQHRGIPLDVPSLISATGSKDANTAEQAAIALRFQKLSAAQISEVVDKCSVAGLLQLALTVHALASPDECDQLLRIAKRCIAAEKKGTDTFTPIPAWGSPWASTSCDTREYLARLVASDAHLVPLSSFLIEHDTNPPIRSEALKRMLELPQSPAQTQILVAALKNSDRRVQAVAASALAGRHTTDAIPELTALLASPAADVRTGAEKTLDAMNHPLPLPDRPLPDAARNIAETLREYGLTDADIICFAARPRDSIFPPEFDPKSVPKPLPAYVKFESIPSDLIGEKGRVVGKSMQYKLTLDTSYRMLDFSPYAVEKRTGEYACGFGLEWGFLQLDPTGPFLLAAALEIGDEKSARRIYERMAVEFPTDADALDRGLTALAFVRFDAALEAYRQYRDERAKAMFHDVLQFKKVATPFSLTANYIRQSGELLHQMDVAPPSPPPARADQQTLIRYWIARIPEINGDMPGQPAAPDIWEDDFTREDGFSRFPFASDELRKIGLPAMPALIEIADDRTPTRTVGWWRNFAPERYTLDVGSIAREIIFRICQDNHIPPPKFLSTPTTRPFDTSRPIVSDLRAWHASPAFKSAK